MTTTFDRSADFFLDCQGIMKLIPHRFPMLLVDAILEFSKGEHIVGMKNVTINEPFFAGHFPGHPIMPGVLVIESMAQVGAILIALSAENNESPLYYFRKIERAKFKKPVLPGHCIRHELSLTRKRDPVWRFHGDTYIGEELAVYADLEAVILRT